MSSIGGFRPVQTSVPLQDVEADVASQAAPSAPAAPGRAATPAQARPAALADRNAVMAKLAMLPPEEPEAAVAPPRAEAMAAAGKVDMKKVDADVETLFKAMKGIGTNEKKIFSTLKGTSPEHRMAVQDRFAEKHSKEWLTLRAALKDELSGDELKTALSLLDEGTEMASRGTIQHDKDTSTGFMKSIRKFGTWFSFGLKSDDIKNDPPRLTGKDAQAMLKDLRPGDIILCGNHGGLSHAILYEGDGKIIHAMATGSTARSVLQRLGDTAKEMVGIETDQGKQGVIREGLGEFFDRFERDTYVVMRSPSMTPEKAQAAVAHAKSLIGKEYDYDFRPENGSYYCTEVVGESYRKALAGESPKIGARPQHVPLLLDREAVVDPLDMFASPDLQVATASKSASTFWDLDKKIKK
jgi:hypothetical protein